MYAVIENGLTFLEGIGINIPDTIVIHHAAATKCSLTDIHRWHLERGFKGIGYHYFISKDGDVFRGREDDWAGGHVFGKLNERSLGICLEGNYDTEPIVSAPQLATLIELVRNKRKEYNIPLNKVIPHKDVADTACPGKYFPWLVFNRKINTAVERFQGEYGLTVDNIIGPKTISKVLDCMALIKETKDFLNNES